MEEKQPLILINFNKTNHLAFILHPKTIFFFFFTLKFVNIAHLKK